MTNLIPVRLLYSIKTSWYKAYGSLESLKEGEYVIIRTSSEKMFGQVVGAVVSYKDNDFNKALLGEGSLDGRASEADVKHADEIFTKSKDALPTFRDLVKKSNLEMNPIAVEYLFDRNKAICYYDSETRVDYRELIHELSSAFSASIEMKQIGVRDGARMIGGLGHCGQELCCSRTFCSFKPVTIKMAKVQKLSLNPGKISGMCGRLMCCLRYEYEAYEDFYARAPKKNTPINTPDGEGKIVDFDVLKESVHIKVDDKKPVIIPLENLSKPNRHKDKTLLEVDKAVWEERTSTNLLDLDSAVSAFSSQLNDEGVVNDNPQQVVHHRPKSSSKKKDETSPKKPTHRRRSHSRSQGQSSYDKKRTRRRSTSIVNDEDNKKSSPVASKPPKKEKKHRPRRRKNKDQSVSKTNRESNRSSQTKSKVGRRSSGLRKRTNQDSNK